MRLLPAISLHQPYASLLFVTEPELRKWHETRGRKLPANRRGVRHAIHAAKRKIAPRTLPGELHRLCVDAFGWDYRESLPFGAAIGTGVFGDSYPTEEREPLSRGDRIGGIWTSGRHAWTFLDPELLATPVPMPGRQSWFSAELP